MGCGSSKLNTVVAESDEKHKNAGGNKDLSSPNNQGIIDGSEVNKLKQEDLRETQSSTPDATDLEQYEQRRKRNLVRPSCLTPEVDDKSQKMTAKSEASEERIWKAIQDSSVLSQFETNQKNGICHNMYLREFKAGTYIIRKEEMSIYFVVVETGELEVTDEKSQSIITSGDTYGDINLFHPGPSTIDVKAVTDVSLWMINGSDFQVENYKIETNQTDKYVSLLKEIPLLKNLTEEQLIQMVSMLQVDVFNDNQYIIKKGERGTKFYIIKSGVAICYGGESDIKNDIGDKDKNNDNNNNNNKQQQDKDDKKTEEKDDKVIEFIKEEINQQKGGNGRIEIRRLHENDYFGEIALLHDIPRTIDVVSYGTTECWVLRRDAFDKILGSLENILQRNMKRRFLDSAPVLSPLKPEQREQLVDSVEIEKFEDNSIIFHEGDIGDKFYIIQKGEVVCYKSENGKEIELRHLTINEYFGERALIKEEARSASIKTIGSVTVLSISRDAFIKHLGPMEQLLERKKMEEFINSLKFFGSMQLPPMAQELLVENSKVMEYNANDVIIHFNDQPSSFFIIEDGSVIQETNKGTKNELNKGSYFGEVSILSNEPSKYQFTAVDHVRCIILTIKEFGDIVQPMLYKLDELDVLGVLGLGGFALVKKVKPKNSNSIFALKAVSKTKLQSNSAKRNIMNEKKLMSEMNHPFLVKLITTFQDDNYVYMLQEFIESGDLRTLLLHRRTGRLYDEDAKFYSAVILLGLEHLHSKKIVYRDLKPENVLLCSNGYVKIADFGNAKIIIDRTYSLCGTPDYMAPEIWLNKGHGFSADIWAYGVLVYEFLNGETPFELTREGGQSEQISKIIKGRVSYPLFFTTDATDFIRSILRLKPLQRLGCNKEGISEIRHHKWLSNMDYNSLLKHEIKPPYTPSQNYIDRCCEAFNQLSEKEIYNATVDKRGNATVWIEGF